MDSAALLSLFISVEEPDKRDHKVDFATIREAFDNADLNAVQCCTAKKLMANPLTKHRPATTPLLFEAHTTGKYERPLEMKTNLGPPQTDKLQSPSINRILAKRRVEK